MGLIQSTTLLVASVLSGMLGVGVGFAAIPLLSFSYVELAHQVQPIALFLNGISALFAAIAFAAVKVVDWRRAALLTLPCTVFTPLGALASPHAPASVLWMVYLIAVAIIAVQLLRAPRERAAVDRFQVVLPWSAAIALVSGLLGVGPGFLLVPLLVAFGVSPRAAAGVNSVAVVPASFGAFLVHLPSMHIGLSDLAAPVLVTAVGAGAGAALAGKFVSERVLKHLFVMILIGICLYRSATLVTASLIPERPACLRDGATEISTAASAGPACGDQRSGRR